MHNSYPYRCAFPLFGLIHATSSSSPPSQSSRDNAPCSSCSSGVVLRGASRRAASDNADMDVVAADVHGTAVTLVTRAELRLWNGGARRVMRFDILAWNAYEFMLKECVAFDSRTRYKGDAQHNGIGLSKKWFVGNYTLTKGSVGIQSVSPSSPSFYLTASLFLSELEAAQSQRTIVMHFKTITVAVLLNSASFALSTVTSLTFFTEPNCTGRVIAVDADATLNDCIAFSPIGGIDANPESIEYSDVPTKLVFFAGPSCSDPNLTLGPGSGCANAPPG
ncbi:hypothetical protein GGX14DRAFT_563209 [Mycena pura]|uniref:Uncharacterized protein n=1 Tax=Mycena pura TaxID=153505 RepID=A0AAD6VIW7_9AGAR|nr:hypothetical protein GGX14DRAFT_563209 [Mycena pura]